MLRVKQDALVLYRSDGEQPSFVTLNELFRNMEQHAGHAGLGQFDLAWAWEELERVGWCIGHGDQGRFLIALVEDVLSAPVSDAERTEVRALINKFVQAWKEKH